MSAVHINSVELIGRVSSEAQPRCTDLLLNQPVEWFISRVIELRRPVLARLIAVEILRWPRLLFDAGISIRQRRSARRTTHDLLPLPPFRQRY